MRVNTKYGRTRPLSRFGLLIGVLLPLVACDLEVSDPDIITPESLTGEAGIEAFYAGAIGDFALAYDGGAGGGSFLDGYVTTSAYVSDEAYLSGTFPTRRQFDQRNVNENNGTLANVFSRLQRARRATESAADVVAERDPEDPRVGELQSLAGFLYIAFGEGFCSGVPFSSAPLGGDLEFGGPQSTSEIFGIALARLDDGEANAGGDEDLVNLAKVGQGRALLNLGLYEEAAAAVADVPDDFVYLITHSAGSGRQENGLSAANEQTLRLSIAEDEGGSGTPYRDGSDDGEGLNFLTAEDPRVPFEAEADAFDSTVDTTYILLAYGGFGIPLEETSPSPLASGVEARLIEAEAALNGPGGAAAALLILNDLRARVDGLDPLLAVDTDVLFEERAFWLYGTGHRLGDLRRLVRQYGRNQASVFPTGAYFKGGSYGTDVNLPIPQEEQNNPNFDQCLDRNA